jgi:hypothetical protein
MADKKDKKDKGSEAAATNVLRIAGHPRAARSVRTIKGWAGLAGFAVTLWLSLQAGTPFYWASVRAVIAGFVAYVVAWACAVTVWRNLLLAQVEAARAQRLEELAKQADA